MRVRLFFGLMLASLALGLHAGCGKDVSLGAGPPAASDAGDAHANACVAAGGTCISAGATCEDLEDPVLGRECAPSAPRCCLPQRDAGPVDLVIGGADAPDARGDARP